MAKKMNPIDRILKEKLEGMQVPFDAGSWQLMEQKLEEEPIGMEGQQIADIKDSDESTELKEYPFVFDHACGIIL